MKRKQFVKGVEQIAQEGAIQIFKIPDSGFEDVVVGVVGTLQFDVFEYRMKNEYGVDLRMSGLPYEHLRLIRECPCDVKDLMLCSAPACSRTSRAASSSPSAASGAWAFSPSTTKVSCSMTGSACDFARKLQKHQKERGFRALFVCYFVEKAQMIC